ncbi:MAG: TIM barrel protein [Planctomycetes bacterium]|nr:TIM barrel protein [Planctomycetota bacterium]
MAGQFRFSFGPWNVHEGADPFGPEVRESIEFTEKLKMYKDLGFGAVQFHDDDAVPELNDLSPGQIITRAEEVKKMLDNEGLQAEFVAPRLWEDPRTIDGAYTSNDPEEREYAIERSKRCIDIANALDTDLIVLWLAREGTYIREAKDPVVATQRLVEAVNIMLDYDSSVRIAIEPKPNEPMDQAYIPTTGHALALGMMTDDPDRMGVNIETAHVILAGLSPSDEMGFALSADKLFTVHLNDQNGIKFDEDKSFGVVNPRRALAQVRILDKYDFGQNGEWVGLDVKAMRTQKAEVATKHLRNSRELFLKMLEISRSLDDAEIERLREERDYEELDLYITNQLTGG